MEAIEESISHLASFEHEKSNNIDIAPPPLIESASSNGISVVVECDQVDSEVAANPIVSEKMVSVFEGNSDDINRTVEVKTVMKNIEEPGTVAETVVVEETPVEVYEKHNLEPHDNSVTADPAVTVLPTEAVEISIESINAENKHIDSEAIKKEDNVSVVDTMQFKALSSEDTDATNNILSQLEGEHINLDEALATHENASTGENNNGVMKQSQMLNKEELLDILEGNDDGNSTNTIEKQLSVNKLQSSLALQQFIELKQTKQKNPRTRSSSVFREKHKSLPNKKSKKQVKQPSPNTSQNIVSNIVEDWNDDEMVEVVIDINASKSETENCLETTVTDQSKDIQETDSHDDSNVDHQNESQDHNESNKSIDSSNRRAGRVIKKKIIFDPDNPDTFTKSKSKLKENNTEKSQSSVKKIKVEPEPKAKSPVNKTTTWKKPHAKNKNQNKHRLTEVEKLLMDEGAANMINEVTPESSKGKKHMRTKAELIKKINQTLETKEKKFRERRREPSRSEEHEGKKALSNKQRMSLSSSVKSPAGFDDFETHSADDSIIYRRHSSSSYSSTCMSPRRLSDVEGSIIQNAKLAALISSTPTSSTKLEVNNQPHTDGFMSGDADITSDDTIVKKACLNLKKKLNSTLPQALNVNMKRKSDSKEDKPTKQRKSSRITAEEVVPQPKPAFGNLTINIKNKVAEIVLKKIGCPNMMFNAQTLKELTEALKMINNTNSVVVTVLLSENGELCTGLDLNGLLTTDVRCRREAAVELADSVRNVFQCLEQHSKVLLCGVEGVCEGTALAMLALCDVAMATDTTIFSWSMTCQQPLIPGLCVLSSKLHTIPTAVVNNMVYTNSRFVGASVIPRVVSWPTRVVDHLRTLAINIAEDPVQILKKRLMLLNRSADTKASFLKSLEAERDMLVDHWCSAEGQELIKACCRSV